MAPFLLFAQALHHSKPELNIFAYRDSLLVKAVYALINQTDQSGEFFPINDAQKGMSKMANSAVSAVNIAFLSARGRRLSALAIRAFASRRVVARGSLDALSEMLS